MTDDATTPKPDPTPVRGKSVILATDHAHTFTVGDFPPIVHEGTVVTAAQADEIRTVAAKMDINLTVKDA